MAGKISGSSETIIKLGLVFFISLLSFAIGTLVGSEYRDRQHKLSKMEPSEDHGDAHRSTASSEGVNKLSDEEIAKLSKEFMTDDTPTTGKEAHGSAQNSGAASESHENSSGPHGAQASAKAPAEFEEMNDDALEAAQALIEGREHPAADPSRKVAAVESKPSAATTKKSNTSSLSQTLPKNAAQESVGKYTVQVGAFAKEDEAKSRAERLKQKGYSAFYVPGVVGGKTWYRVNVGTYSTLDEAKRANEKYTADNSGQKGFIKEIQ